MIQFVDYNLLIYTRTIIYIQIKKKQKFVLFKL